VDAQEALVGSEDAEITEVGAEAPRDTEQEGKEIIAAEVGVIQGAEALTAAEAEVETEELVTVAIKEEEGVEIDPLAEKMIETVILEERNMKYQLSLKDLSLVHQIEIPNHLKKPLKMLLLGGPLNRLSYHPKNAIAKTSLNLMVRGVCAMFGLYLIKVPGG
jgi:hypothetical protein